MIQAKPNRFTIFDLWPFGAEVSDRAMRTRPQQALLAILLIIGVAAVLCLYLFQTSRITVTNYGISDLQQDYARLQRENSNLLARYAHEQSMAQMKKRALAAGFVPTVEMEYITLTPKNESGQTAAVASSSSPQLSQITQQTTP